MESPKYFTEASGASVIASRTPSKIRAEAERLTQLATQLELLVEQLREKLRPISFDAPQVANTSTCKDERPAGSELGHALEQVASRLNVSLQDIRVTLDQLDI